MRIPTRPAALAGSLFALVGATGCFGPSVPHPLDGTERFTCCNMRYERDVLTDVNYLRGALLPLGTRVRIVEVGRGRVTFEPPGQPPLTLALKYGRRNLTMDQYLERVFLPTDPGAKLARLPSARRKQVEQGAIEPGMTREHVLMSVGHPPAHRTPSLDGNVWTYWNDRWTSFEVYFDGDVVSRVGR